MKTLWKQSDKVTKQEFEQNKEGFWDDMVYNSAMNYMDSGALDDMDDAEDWATQMLRDEMPVWDYKTFKWALNYYIHDEVELKGPPPRSLNPEYGDLTPEEFERDKKKIQKTLLFLKECRTKIKDVESFILKVTSKFKIFKTFINPKGRYGYINHWDN